jgi:hypothetical protein
MKLIKMTGTAQARVFLLFYYYYHSFTSGELERRTIIPLLACTPYLHTIQLWKMGFTLGYHTFNRCPALR